MVRVATILKKFRADIDDMSIDGLNTEQELAAIRQRALEQMDLQSACWSHSLRPLLAAEGIHFIEPADYTPAMDQWLKQYFDTHIFPVLTPLAFDPGHPFPYISNLSMNLAVRVKHGGRTKFARVKVPGMLPRFIADPREPGAAAGHVVRLSRGRHSPQHPGALSRHARRRRAPVPHHPRHRHGDPGRRGRRPARNGRPRPEAAALRRAVAAAGRRRHAAPRAQHPGRELRGRRRHRRAHVGAHGICRLVGADQDAPADAEGSGLPSAAALDAGPGRQGVRADRRSGLPDPPPVRFVHDGRDVPARGGQRSAGRRDQDDAVPDRRRTRRWSIC